MIDSLQKRRFQTWEYKVSHGSLLIRSPKGGKYKNNIDIVFSGVEYLEVPRMFNEISLDQATDLEYKRLLNIVGKDITLKNIIVLVSNSKRYFVVSAGMNIIENDKDIFDSVF